jgi:hypothetical protein
LLDVRDARIAVLVKAYPQPSQSYQETVCVAGIDLDTGKLMRLYPVPYRTLRLDQQFDRYDCIQGRIFKATEDPRPESFKIEPTSIRIERPGRNLSARSKVELWAHRVSPSLSALQADNVDSNVSLGVIAPDAGSLRLRSTPIAEADEQARLVAYAAAQQQSIFEELPNFVPLIPEYVFRYRYTSDGVEHQMQIIDWEIQAAWFSYKRKYGNDAMLHLKNAYTQKMAQQNLHLVLGTTREHMRNFTIIGLLRSTIPPNSLRNQTTFL